MTRFAILEASLLIHGGAWSIGLAHGLHRAGRARYRGRTQAEGIALQNWLVGLLQYGEAPPYPNLDVPPYTVATTRGDRRSGGQHGLTRPDGLRGLFNYKLACSRFSVTFYNRQLRVHNRACCAEYLAPRLRVNTSAD